MSRIANDRPLGQKDPPIRDAAYLRWLHVDIPCIACVIGVRPNPPLDQIEAAHMKLAVASRGWREGGAGPKVSDRRCVVLCSWHHRLAPDSCDNGQRQFWDRLGLGDRVADLCDDLYQAFQAGALGRAVVIRFAQAATR